MDSTTVITDSKKRRNKSINQAGRQLELVIVRVLLFLILRLQDRNNVILTFAACGLGFVVAHAWTDLKLHHDVIICDEIMPSLSFVAFFLIALRLLVHAN